MARLTRRDFGLTALAALTIAGAPAWSRAKADWHLGFTTAPAAIDGELQWITGKLPADLLGTFYRIGPAQFERGGERLGHWFDGDGMIQRFTFDGRGVRHRGRFVDTEKRRAEAAAEKFLYAGYGFAPKNLASIRRVDEINAANTSVLPLGDEVWALWEGGSPYRIDARELETRGRKAFDGQFDGAPFSAHPKREISGEIWNFGLLGRKCVIWRLDSSGGVRNSALVTLPEASLMHDFAITSRHVVLLAPPMIASGARANTLVDHYQWHAEKPLIVYVLDKESLAIVRTYELPGRLLFHIGNAWEDDAGVIRVDGFFDTDATFAVKTARDLVLGSAYSVPTAHLTMLTLSPSGRATIDFLPRPGEFPRIDPRRTGSRHRYTYGVINQGVSRWDWETGEIDSYSYGADTWAEEPVFVSRTGATQETDGWILATVLNYGSARTDLCVFDARRISDGPVARYSCPYALPLGFHGAFVAS